jgi:hypothetical protein
MHWVALFCGPSTPWSSDNAFEYRIERFQFCDWEEQDAYQEPPVEKLSDFGFGNIRWSGLRLNIMH